MKIKAIQFCAISVLAWQVVALGQKTEVRVRRGEVVAETASQSVAVGAGRKAILSPDEGLSTTVDDPMVDEVMTIYRWAEQEKQAPKLDIDSISIQSVKIESENRITLAYLWETPNNGSESSTTCFLGNASILDDPKYYDLKGNLLKYDLKKNSEHHGNYTIKFPDPVGPGEMFRYICVSKLNASIPKQGAMRFLNISWHSPNQLNYYRFILPPSAIFVDASRSLVLADSFDGRPAVTLRNYTEAIADGTATVAFLWPDLDGVTMADLPDRYRGLRDSEKEAVVELGRLRMAEIFAGKVYTKQSSPLETLLSLISSVIHKDKAALLDLMGTPKLREIASWQYDEYFSEPLVQGMIKSLELLDTPDWPSDPPNYYSHPVYLSRKGTQLCVATCDMLYRDGKWYHNGLNMYDAGAVFANKKFFRNVILTQDKPVLDSVTYNGLKTGEFMNRWLFLGPIHTPWDGPGDVPDDTTRREWFKKASLPLETFQPTLTLNGQTYKWHVLEAQNGIFGLQNMFGVEYIVGYAWAQIEMDRETKSVLGIGSNDDIQVFLNGNLVHESRIGRGLKPDDDKVPVTFKKGKNQLVLKIMNGTGPWGFSCRLLDQ